MKKIVSLAILLTVLAACSDKTTDNSGIGGYGSDGFSEESLSTGATETALNDTYLLTAAPKYYVGSPYKVENIQYVPAEDMYYNQTGVAGIIPAELNGTKTSNGETFDANQMVATSKTLPLPTIARVTNMDNGTSVVVRINNRGPFVNTRIMDLSPAAARKLGISGQAKVQVQVMAEQSAAVKNATLGTNAIAAPTETYMAPAPVASSGEYNVQVGAFYAEDSATSLSQRMQKYGNAVVVKEGDMYKVQITGLDAQKARSVIDTLRSSEGMAPGLLKGGRWVNSDSI